MRILPRIRREAIFGIYDFCRAVDDIADSTGPRTDRLAQLQRWRLEVDALYRGTPTRLQSLLTAVENFSLEKKDLLAIIDGMEMDVVTDIRAPDFAFLDLYCDRVASAVGRLCVRVFGMDLSRGEELAHHLGRALQLTNILRDLDEDAAIGRLYLPMEALQGAGITSTDPATVLSHGRVSEVCLPVVERARNHFRQAESVMQSSPRRTVRAPRIMAEVYKMKLAALAKRGWSPPRHAVSTNRFGLLWILGRYAIL